MVDTDTFAGAIALIQKHMTALQAAAGGDRETFKATLESISPSETVDLIASMAAVTSALEIAVPAFELYLMSRAMFEPAFRDAALQHAEKEELRMNARQQTKQHN